MAGKNVDHAQSEGDAQWPVLLVRLRLGVVGETRRTCHIVPVPKENEIPDVLAAYCGIPIEPGTAELLDGPAGMPCVLCVANAPMPSPHENAAGDNDDGFKKTYRGGQRPLWSGS